MASIDLNSDLGESFAVWNLDAFAQVAGAEVVYVKLHRARTTRRSRIGPRPTPSSSTPG